MIHGFDLSAGWIQKAEQDLGDDDLWLSLTKSPEYYRTHTMRDVSVFTCASGWVWT